MTFEPATVVKSVSGIVRLETYVEPDNGDMSPTTEVCVAAKDKYRRLYPKGLDGLQKTIAEQAKDDPRHAAAFRRMADGMRMIVDRIDAGLKEAK